jgi:hypothetical protein
MPKQDTDQQDTDLPALLLKRIQSLLDEIDADGCGWSTNRPVTDIMYRADQVRAALAKLAGNVCSSCNGMGKIEHEPGDEPAWAWACGKCKGTGQPPEPKRGKRWRREAITIGSSRKPRQQQYRQRSKQPRT